MGAWVSPLKSQNQSEFNGMIRSSNVLNKYSRVNATNEAKAKDNKPGSVSLFYLPSWDESGSYAHFLNDNKGNSIFGIFSDHFKHVFSVIGSTGPRYGQLEF